jgi:hypothetical protein
MNPMAADRSRQTDADIMKHQRTTRIIEVVSVILLSVTTVVTAWSAYQASTWGTMMSINFSQASTKRMLATRATAAADQLLALDLNLFTNWLNAYAEENTELAKFYEERFRQEFQPAFDAWLATRPRSNPDAPKSPFSMPEYQVSQDAEAMRLDEEAGALFNAGLAANDKRDGYALTTVLLASVLFFVGMAGRMKWFPMQVVMVAIGAVVFLIVAIRLLIYLAA